MKPLFADTSFFLALYNPNDEDHEAAVEWSRVERPLVTTEFVLLEVGNALTRPRQLELFVRLVERLQASLTATTVPCDSKLMRKGFHLFAERSDEEWSLTDCISFVVMKELEIADALTADRHFEQAGFNMLLK